MIRILQTYYYLLKKLLLHSKFLEADLKSDFKT